MKTIIEYKMHRGDSGEFTHPSWLSDSGFFFNGKSYIGTINHIDNKYYIPTGLQHITSEELYIRASAIQNDSNLDVYVDDDGEVLSAKELSTMVDNLIQSWVETTEE
jgi:hypothetical protein